MIKFFAGVLVTLAVLYPAVTKDLFSKAVDTTNSVVTGVVDKADTRSTLQRIEDTIK